MSKSRANAETLRTALVAGDVTNANFTGADLEVGKGGTGASTAGAARTALGVVIGTNVLAPDGNGSALTGIDSLPSQSGNTGKFLTTNGSAASWGTVSAGLTLLSTVTASSSSTVDIETTFDSTYDTYVIYVTNLQMSNQSEYIKARLKLGGVYKQNGNSYSYHYQASHSNGAGYNGAAAGSEPHIRINNGMTNNTVEGGFDGIFYIQDPSNPRTTYRHRIMWQSVYVNNSNNVTTNSGAARHSGAGTGPMTGIRFFPSGGTFTKGTFRLYGIAK